MKKEVRKLVQLAREKKANAFAEAAEKILYQRAAKRLQTLRKEVAGRFLQSESIQEDVKDDLEKIVQKKSPGDVRFRNGQKMPVDLHTANLLLVIHEKLNPTNQKKFSEALNKSSDSFMKMVDFAWSKVR